VGYNRAMQTSRLALVVLGTAVTTGLGCGPKPAPTPPPSPEPTTEVTPDRQPPKGGASTQALPPVPPIAAVRRVSDTYHGVTVDDPYRWLEGDAAEVTAWSDAENRWSRGVLDGLPQLAEVRSEIRAYLTEPLTRYGALTAAGGKLFALRRLPTAQQRDLVVMTRPEDAASATLVFDPAAGGDTHRAIDWFVPSPDGSKVAVSISEGGSESGTLHLLGVDGKELEPPIPNVQRGTGGGDVAWSPDGKVVYYTRYPAPGEKPEAERDFWLQVWSHTLGKPATTDRYELGKDLPKIAEIQLAADARGRVLATVQNGDSGTFRHYLRAPRGGWKRLTDWADGVTAMTLGTGGDLFAVSIKGAPRGQIVRWPAKATSAKAAKVIVPEGDDAIVTDFGDDGSLVVTDRAVFVVMQQGGPTVIRGFELTGKPRPGLALPPVASTAVSAAQLGGDLLVWAESYLTPPTWYRYTPATGALVAIDALSPKPSASVVGYEVRRELATSRDGTKIPLNIVWRTGAAQDGTTPCLVSGYGGFGISTTPGYVGGDLPLLRRGVCLVEVNLRGGGEFGEAWHQAGMLTNKQHVFDDMIAAIEYLSAQRYTSADRTVLLGGSNGGLLMGAMITQRPDLFKAAVAMVGIYDMLRNELTANGLFNTVEYGTVTDPAQFAALHAYSPYHRVVPRTRYPAVLFTTGANDPRVAPWHSRKMVAALQAAQEGSAPILLRTSGSSGHGAGMAVDERIELQAHLAAFVLWQAAGGAPPPR
jgi:prolyl oligopeptidase